MKLSFSLGSKPQSGLKKPSATTGNFTDEVENLPYREYVTEFDSSGLSVDPSKAKQDRVISTIPNELRPYKKMKNIDLPLQTGASGDQQSTLQFEVNPSSSVEPSSNSMSYGLNLRSKNSTNHDDTPAAIEKDPPSAINNGDRRERMILREDDLRKLADENEFEDFDDMPIEGFGHALLGGYGWKEGQGIGRIGKTKEYVKSTEYTRRTGRVGLGFTGELPVRHTKYRQDDGYNSAKKNSGRKSEKDTNGVAQRDEKGLHVGMDVRIVRGRHNGLKASVLEVNEGGEFAVLRLFKSEEDVKVPVSDIANLGSVEEEKCLRKLKELRLREKNEAADRRSEKEKEREKDSKSSRIESKDKGVKNRRGKEEVKGNYKVSWLRSHIRVRIISRELKGGRLYLKKGEVVDVVGPTCDVAMDENKELVQGVDQEFLETALPKRGGPVLVLYGRHKGVYGSLVERDTEKETGVVRDAETHELLNVRLEQVAEYLGDPIGY